MKNCEKTVKIIFMICVSTMFTTLSFAQQSEKFRVGFETGLLALPHKNGGFGFTGIIEPKYNFRDNMNVGFLVGYTYLQKNKSYQPSFRLFSVTYDYYYRPRSSGYSPFIGAGAGYYFGRNDESLGVRKFNNPTCIARIGFEFGQFRTSLTYNLIRMSKGGFFDKNNDYISLTIGFYLGGGKWKQR